MGAPRLPHPCAKRENTCAVQWLVWHIDEAGHSGSCIKVREGAETRKPLKVLGAGQGWTAWCTTLIMNALSGQGAHGCYSSVHRPAASGERGTGGLRGGDEEEGHQGRTRAVLVWEAP